MAGQRVATPRIYRKEALNAVFDKSRDDRLTRRIVGSLYFDRDDTIPGEVVNNICDQVSRYASVPVGEYCATLGVEFDQLMHILSCVGDGRIMNFLQIANPSERVHKHVYVVRKDVKLSNIRTDLMKIRDELSQGGMSWKDVAMQVVRERGLKPFSPHLDQALNYLMKRSGNSAFQRVKVARFMQTTAGYREFILRRMIMRRNLVGLAYDSIRGYRGDMIIHYSYPINDRQERDLVFVKVNERGKIDFDRFRSELGLNFGERSWAMQYFARNQSN